jgi:hypothetical protein
MPTKQQDQPQAERDNPQLLDGVGQQVLQRLGNPRDVYRVQVRKLWGNHCRVNVLTGADAANIKMAHSFFLTLDGDGKIVSANPEF